MRFEKLRLEDYGVFQGAHEFIFERNRTVIVGRSGSGKTTLASALASLGPAQGTQANVRATTTRMSVTVATHGNRALIRKYRHLIFLGGAGSSDYADPVSRFTIRMDAGQREACTKKARVIFEELVQAKPWKVQEPRDLGPSRMSAGERVSLAFAYAVAARQTLGFDLPLVLDGPYARLDQHLRGQLDVFLRRQRSQQIFLLGEHECGDEHAHYRLA